MPFANIRFLLATVLLLSSMGCAEGPPDAAAEESEAPYDDEPATETGLESLTVLADQVRPPRVVYGRAAPGTSQIESKLASLTAQVKADFFAAPITSIVATPDGTPYQFFRGALGKGAVYVVNGTQAVWGPILEAWAQQGYERGWLGYPTAAAVTWGSQPREQQFFVDQVAPWVDNGGLQKIRRLLKWNGSASQPAQYAERREYLDSNQPLTPRFQPQPCVTYSSSYPQGSIQATISPGSHDLLWCGAPPPWLNAGYVESTDVDLGTI